jgi:Leucine-rich repeat (LRR) protein
MDPRNYLRLWMQDNNPEDILYLDNVDSEDFPELPNNVKYLHCNGPKLTKLPDNLPDSIYSMTIQYTNLEKLPNKLPASLCCLTISHSKLPYITHIPSNTIEYLKIEHNETQSITVEKFPPSLIHLSCNFNPLLTYITDDMYNSNIEILGLSSNQLTKLPTRLPKHLKKLWCHQNKIQYMPKNMPTTIIKIECHENAFSDVMNRDYKNDEPIKSYIKRWNKWHKNNTIH